MKCQQCLEAQAAFPLQVCLRCYVDDQIGRAELEKEWETEAAELAEAKNEEPAKV